MTVREQLEVIYEDTPLDIIWEGHGGEHVYSSKKEVPEYKLDKEIDEIMACNEYEDAEVCGIPLFQPILCIVLKGDEDVEEEV